MIRMDHSELKRRIRETFKTQAAFAQALSLSPAALSARLNNRTDFTMDEMQRAYDLLQLSPADFNRCFFNPEGTGHNELRKWGEFAVAPKKKMLPEDELLELFGVLNKAGQKEALTRLEDMVECGKWPKGGNIILGNFNRCNPEESDGSQNKEFTGGNIIVGNFGNSKTPAAGKTNRRSTTTIRALNEV